MYLFITNTMDNTILQIPDNIVLLIFQYYSQTQISYPSVHVSSKFKGFVE